MPLHNRRTINSDESGILEWYIGHDGGIHVRYVVVWSDERRIVWEAGVQMIDPHIVGEERVRDGEAKG